MYLDKNGLNVIIKVSRNAKGIEGTSNLMKADREQPVGGKAHVEDRGRPVLSRIRELKKHKKQ